MDPLANAHGMPLGGYGQYSPFTDQPQVSGRVGSTPAVRPGSAPVAPPGLVPTPTTRIPYQRYIRRSTADPRAALAYIQKRF